MSQSSTTQGAAETLSGAQGDLIGLAMLGKTALALAVVIGAILLCSVLLKRIGPTRGRGNRHLNVVASTAIGQRERVVIVEVEGTWLVLGTGGGQVNMLHQLPAPDVAGSDDSLPSTLDSGSFATRFANAMRHNAKARFSGRGSKSGDQE